MSILERRLQVLLDQARYERVSAEAQRSGRSVAAVIREAIDLRFPTGEDERAQALTALLELTGSPAGPAESWEDIKAGLERALDEKLS